MEWNKIEKDWKEKLNKREISSSDLAWRKIVQELDKQDSKVKKLHYKKWLSLAACILIGSFITVKILKPEVVPQTDIQTETEQAVFPEHPIVEGKEEVITKEQPENILSEPKKNIAVSSQEKPEIKTESQYEKSVYTEEKAIAESESGEEITVKIPETENNQEPEIEGKPVRFNTSNRVVINSDLLLNQVESEIETEYRETKITKIFEAAKRAVVYISESNYEESN